MIKAEKSRSSFGWPEWLAITMSAAVILGAIAILSPAFRGFIGSGVTAAWVQALGSIGAILASASFVLWKHKLDLMKEEDSKAEDLRVMLESIKIEVEAIWADLDALVGDTIEVSGNPLQDWVFVYSEQNFPVYRALVPRIAMIPSTALRMQIVQTYSKANSWFLKMGLHNELKKRIDELRFQLTVATTRPSGASILELKDVFTSPDITAVGISEYEAVARELTLIKAKLATGAGQLVNGVSSMRDEVSRLISNIDDEVLTR